MRPFSTLCLLLLAMASPARAQVITGTILDDASGAAVRSARVSILPGGQTALSDSLGRFRIGGVAAREYSIQVQMIGYAPLSGALEVPAEGVEVELRMTPRAVEVEGVRVEAGYDVPGTGFAARRERHGGSGVFMDRRELEPRERSGLDDVLRSQVPGIYLVHDPETGAVYASSTSGQAPQSLMSTQVCYAQVILDGTPISDSAARPIDLRQFLVGNLEAIEYYRHPSSTPVQFRSLVAGCGTLVLWTRRN